MAPGVLTQRGGEGVGGDTLWQAQLQSAGSPRSDQWPRAGSGPKVAGGLGRGCSSETGAEVNSGLLAPQPRQPLGPGSHRNLWSSDSPPAGLRRALRQRSGLGLGWGPWSWEYRSVPGGGGGDWRLNPDPTQLQPAQHHPLQGAEQGSLGKRPDPFPLWEGHVPSQEWGGNGSTGPTSFLVLVPWAAAVALPRVSGVHSTNWRQQPHSLASAALRWPQRRTAGCWVRRLGPQRESLDLAVWESPSTLRP